MKKKNIRNINDNCILHLETSHFVPLQMIKYFLYEIFTIEPSLMGVVNVVEDCLGGADIVPSCLAIGFEYLVFVPLLSTSQQINIREIINKQICYLSFNEQLILKNKNLSNHPTKQSIFAHAKKML